MKRIMTARRTLPSLRSSACHPFATSRLHSTAAEAGGRAGTPSYTSFRHLTLFQRTNKQGCKMMPSQKSLLRVFLLTTGLSLALGFLVGLPAIPIPSSTRATSFHRDATVVHAGPTLLPTKSMPGTQPAGLGSKVFLPAFLPPWIARDTVRTQVSEDIFFLEQAQTFVNVSVNIRSTIIRLKNGKLFVHAPVAPTAECISLLKDLGEVAYVVLPVTAVEHKVYMASFVAQFPKAKVYVAPGQFSWPLNLPLGFRVDGILTDENKEMMPFKDEIDYTGWFFRPFTGSISEVAFFHKKTKTLLVTDAVIWIDNAPPEILKQKGIAPNVWKKMALQACFLGPPNLDTFEEIKQKLIVSPVIRILVVSRAKREVRDWIARVCRWNFERIIPAHFSAPIKAGPKDLRDAYSFLEEEEGKEGANVAASPSPAFGFDLSAFNLGGVTGKGRKRTVVFPEKDTKILDALNKFVSATGLAD